MRNTWLLPGNQRVTHCSDHPLSARTGPAVHGSSPFPARLFLRPPRPRPAPLCSRKHWLPHPHAAQRALRRRWRKAAPARLAHPRVRSWLPAALRGAGAPGSAPAVSRARPPPGAGPAAAALRTPPAPRQRQQLQLHCPSSYFSDGSSWCCLGKRFFPPARNRFPTFHQST